LKVGSSGGRSSKTRIVIRTANTASENALSRSGVLFACSTAVAPFFHRRRLDVLPSSEGSAPRPRQTDLTSPPVHPQHCAGHPPCRRRHNERHNVRYSRKEKNILEFPDRHTRF